MLASMLPVTASLADTTSSDTVSASSDADAGSIGIPTGDGITSNSGTWYFFLSDTTVANNVTLYGDKDGDYYNGDAMRDTVFSEHLGLWTEAELDYALWIPDSYVENPNGNFAMVTNHPVSQKNNVHPASLTPVYATGDANTNSGLNPAYYTSDDAAEVVADKHDLDGIFVVVPVISNAGRVQDDATLPTQYSLMLLLYDALIEQYPIDTDYIYGTGESVGGMVLPQINTHRDNFYAGYVIHGSQWYSNYYKDTVWNSAMLSGSGNSANPARLERHYTLTDDRIIWDYDSGGEYDDLAWQNVYYMTSNNNVLALSNNNAWSEWSSVINGLTGYDFTKFTLSNVGSDYSNLLTMIDDADNTYNGENMGLWWVTDAAAQGNSGNPGVGNAYVGEWLLSQTNPKTESRAKLDINKPFAGTVGTAETSTSSGYTGVYQYAGIGSYFWVPTSGAGTLFYNSIMLRPPGWLPSVQNTAVSTSDEAEDLESLLTHSVSAAAIQSVTKVSSDGDTLIVALEYNVDMENAVIHMVNDEVQSEYYFVDNSANATGFTPTSYPRANFVVMDSFDFYDDNGDLINDLYDIEYGNGNVEYVTSMKSRISKIYINDEPEAVENAGDRTGSGNYVIVEIATAENPDTVSVVQRAPIIAPEANALSSANYRAVTSLSSSTDDDLTVSFTLYPKRSTLTVTDEAGAVITPEADGTYLLPNGSYTYTVTKENYVTVQKSFTVDNQDLAFDITLSADVDLSVYKDLNLDPDTWYLGHVEYSVANNLFIGISNEEWAPSMDLSRAMFVTALGKFEGVDISQYSTCAFTDVGDGLYYTAYTQWAYEEGLVAGIGGGKFDPDRGITRQEMAQIFMMYAAYKGIDITTPDGSAFESFKDMTSTSDWAVPAMTWATANGVINGDNGNLKPVSNTTRAEAAAIFRAVIENII